MEMEMENQVLCMELLRTALEVRVQALEHPVMVLEMEMEMAMEDLVLLMEHLV